MKKIHEELRVIRQQMEEDYLLHSERISAQNQSIERIDKAFAKVQFDLRETRSVVSRLEDGYGKVETRLGKLESGFGKLESGFGKLESGLGKLESRLGKVESGFGKLKADVTQLQTDVGELQADLGDVKGDVGDVKGDVGVLKGDVGVLKGDVGVLKSDVSELTTEFSGMRASARILGEALEKTSDSLGELRGEYRDFAHHTGAYHETWALERKRNLRLFDVIQTSLLTDGLETEARLERVEQRIDRLEEGAA